MNGSSSTSDVIYRALHLPDGPRNYDEMPWELSSLTDTDEMILSILPVLSGFASILGSATIIRIALSQSNSSARNADSKRLTPYKRLLLGTSCSDIISSLTLVLSPFLMPHDSSQRVWAFGTDSTCSTLGFFQQLSLSAMLYNAFLSYYFLLSARYGWKTETIGKKVEPIMHIVSIGYPLATATYGSIKGVYHESEIGMTCWVTNYPEGCDERGEPCESVIIAWIFGGTILLFAFFSIAINNIVIWRYMRMQTVLFRSQFDRSRRCRLSANSPTSSKNALGGSVDRGSSSTHSDEVTEDDINLEAPGECEQSTMTTTNTSQHNEQLRRLQLVTSQALLYVGSFFICFVWTFILKILESLTYNAEDEKDLFPLLVLQAFFLPLQGFLNIFIYVRPKYLLKRRKNPQESRLSTLRKCISSRSARAQRPKSRAKEDATNSKRALGRVPMQSINMQSDSKEKSFLGGTPLVDALSSPTRSRSVNRSRLISSITCNDMDNASQLSDEPMVEIPMESEWRWMSGTNPFKNKKSTRGGGGGYSLEAISELSAVSFVDPDEPANEGSSRITLSSRDPSTGGPNRVRSADLPPGVSESIVKRRATKSDDRFEPSCSLDKSPQNSSFSKEFASYVLHTLERAMSNSSDDDASSSNSEPEHVDPSFDRMASAVNPRDSFDIPMRRPARRLSPPTP